MSDNFPSTLVRTGPVRNMLVVLLAGGLMGPAEGAAARKGFRYPLSPTTNTVDTYFGKPVADPYRWLENDRSPATARWVAAQNQVTFDYLEALPHRNAIRTRLTQLWNYERYSVPLKRGGRYFFTRNDGLQSQSVLYAVSRLEGEPQVVLDPNQMSTDGTVALTGYAVSDDGGRLAYGIAVAGSDWQEWRVIDLAKGQPFPDILRWIKFSQASWSPDGDGFYYSRYDEPKPGEPLRGPNYNQKLYYHTLGQPQSSDTLIYARPDQKEWGFFGQVTDDGRYLIIHVSQGTDARNRVFYLDRQTPDAKVVELLPDLDAAYQFIDNLDQRFLFRTDRGAPLGRVVAIDIESPAPDRWREIIPESTNRLQRVTRVGHELFGQYLQNAASAVRVFDLEGRPLRSVDLPGTGTVGGFGGRRDDTETFYAFASFTEPGAIYRYDLARHESTIFRRPELRFDPERYQTQQVLVRSKDGTRVPMFIVHRKDLVRNGRNPAYLTGYGGFDISLTPTFSPATIVWLEMGGVYALANLRGGGEFGQAWHQAGMKLSKQNVFDDFIAAAEWLIRNDYTRSSALAIGGGSNGGLLVGAAMTQRPGLFAAALPAVGVMDMLRFHKFTIGWAWASEYGSSDNPDEFNALYAYSPLHNLKPGTVYPATLITTADHDDRVVPAHSFKFAAALQAAHAGTTPALIRIETRAGHGAGKPTQKLIEEATDRWAFLVQELHMTLPPDFLAPPAPTEPKPSKP